MCLHSFLFSRHSRSYPLDLCPRVKSALHFHSPGIYLLPCRMVRIIVGSLQSPVYLRLRLRSPRPRYTSVPRRRSRHTHGRLQTGLRFIRLPEQDAQPPLVGFPYFFHINLSHQRRPVRRSFGDLSFPQGEELIPHIDVLRRILLSSPRGNRTTSIPSWRMAFPHFGCPHGGFLLFLLYSFNLLHCLWG